MRLPDDLIDPVPPENAMGEWYANTLNVGSQRYLHYLSESGRLSVIITLRERHDAEHRFLRQLSDLLHDCGVPEKFIDCEVAATSELAFAVARDRSVLGSMRDHALHAKHDLRDGQYGLYDVMRRLAYMPAGALAMSSADEAVPTIIREHWGGSRPVA